MKRLPIISSPYPYDLLVKVLIAGNTSVGKTSLLYRLTDDKFDSDSPATIGVEFATAYFTNEPSRLFGQKNDDTHVTVKTQIWDCAGQVKFQSIVNSYFRTAGIVVFVYDIGCYQSFVDLKRWVEKADIALDSRPHIKCIICNKIDLPQDQHVVETILAKDYANSIGALFAETSAKKSIDKSTESNNDISFESILCKCLDEAYKVFRQYGTILEKSSITMYQQKSTVKLNSSNSNLQLTQASSSKCSDCF